MTSFGLKVPSINASIYMQTTTAYNDSIWIKNSTVLNQTIFYYRAEWQEPIVVRVSEEHTLYSVPLPGSGSVLAFILNMLREWVGTGSDAPVDSNLYWHRIVETFKFAYARRTGLGDSTRSNLPFSIAEVSYLYFYQKPSGFFYQNIAT